MHQTVEKVLPRVKHHPNGFGKVKLVIELEKAGGEERKVTYMARSIRMAGMTHQYRREESDATITAVPSNAPKGEKATRTRAISRIAAAWSTCSRGSETHRRARAVWMTCCTMTAWKT